MILYPSRSKHAHHLSAAAFLSLIAIPFLPLTAAAGIGAQRLLYTVPNTGFIEDPTSESVVTVTDTSGTISGVQSAINNARSANPSKVIVIKLKTATTYTVSTSSLTLGSHECLVASGATVKAASNTVTVPLISISSGATNVSVAGGTLDGNGANVQGINAPSASRVNVDKVIVKNCGGDCILLKGKGNTTYDNEMTVTRCDCSGSAAHAGISIQNSTQTYVGDNFCHGNAQGIYLSCAWANVVNNICTSDDTGINVASGNDNVIASNSCNNDDVGIHAAGSNGMIVGNSLSACATAGISSAGTTNNFLYNQFGGGGANGTDLSNTTNSNNVMGFKSALSSTGQNYFYPPLIDNQHTSSTIVNGMGRTDVTISSTSISSVQSQYNSARSANPGNVIVLHLNGTFTLGSTPLTLQSNTCVLLNGTIQISSSTSAVAAISTGSSATRVSISGGTIDGANLTGTQGFDMTHSNSMICIDKVTIQKFGDNAVHYDGSDAIHFNGGTTPSMVTRCTINKSGARGIWAGTSNHKVLYSDNYVGFTRAGIDCDFHTFGAVCLFNTLEGNTYGLWYEQGAQHNTGVGNISIGNERGNLIAGNLDEPQTTAYNNFFCNISQDGGGISCGATGTGTTTSHNVFFDNVALNCNMDADFSSTGTQNYYSQNYLSGGSLRENTNQVFFNSSDVKYSKLVDRNSGKVAAVQGASTSNGADIVLQTFAVDQNDNDQWQLIPTDSGYFRIVNRNSGLSMAVEGASTADGASIIQYAFGSGENDQWMPMNLANGYYKLVNRNSSKVLDVLGAGTADETPFDQATSDGGKNQQFQFINVP